MLPRKNMAGREKKSEQQNRVKERGNVRMSVLKFEPQLRQSDGAKKKKFAVRETKQGLMNRRNLQKRKRAVFVITVYGRGTHTVNKGAFEQASTSALKKTVQEVKKKPISISIGRKNHWTIFQSVRGKKIVQLTSCRSRRRGHLNVGGERKDPTARGGGGDTHSFEKGDFRPWRKTDNESPGDAERGTSPFLQRDEGKRGVTLLVLKKKKK